MYRPDFRDYKGRGVEELMHSAKGTTWKNHKYLKKVNGRYIYPKKVNRSSASGNKVVGDVNNLSDDFGRSFNAVKDEKDLVILKKKEEKLKKTVSNYKTVYNGFWAYNRKTPKTLVEYAIIGKQFKEYQAELTSIETERKKLERKIDSNKNTQNIKKGTNNGNRRTF